MADNCCPFCEAPITEKHETIMPDGDNGPREPIFRVHLEAACGSGKMHGRPWDRSVLCECRQRLFDDVLARCAASYEREPTGAVPRNLAGAATHRTYWEFHWLSCIERAREIVAARYPLPAKDAPHA